MAEFRVAANRTDLLGCSFISIDHRITRSPKRMADTRGSPDCRGKWPSVTTCIGRSRHNHRPLVVFIQYFFFSVQITQHLDILIQALQVPHKQWHQSAIAIFPTSSLTAGHAETSRNPSVSMGFPYLFLPSFSLKARKQSLGESVRERGVARGALNERGLASARDLSDLRETARGCGLGGLGKGK